MAERIPRLIIELSGGTIHDIVADTPVDIWLIDHDVIEEGGSPELFPVSIDPSDVDQRFEKAIEEQE